MSLITIVVPVYNEQECLKLLYERLKKVEQLIEDDFEYIFVNDGSSDDSLLIIKDLRQANADIKYISFSRNFGHEPAITAGLDHASGDAVVIIDADLQDPPEVIPELIAKWREDNQMVYARRRKRKGESILKRFTSWSFYRIIRLLSSVSIPVDTGDFCIMDKCVVEHFRRCREKSRFVRGLIAWTGFNQAEIVYDCEERFAGKTKYSYFKLIVLAFDAVIGFSNLPLRMAIFLGFSVCIFAIIMFLNLIFQKLFCCIPIQGYALSVSGMFFLGGIQLAMLGIIGEYIGRIYCETQHRPLYIIKEKSAKLPAQKEGFYPKENAETN